MQVNISGRGVVLTPALKTLVARKVTRLGRVLPGAAEARVVCETEKFRRRVRLTLRATRRSLATEATAADLLAAVDEAVETLRRQAREAKDRRRPARGRRAGGLRPVPPVA